MPRRALLLINRHARRGALAYDEVVAALQAGELEIVFDEPESESVGEAIRKQKGHVDLVIVGGGDGTLNDAIPALHEAALPLGIVPLGTANDLARTLRIPTDPLEACETILTGVPKPIDVGSANGHFYFNVASIGLSVDITRRLSPELKRRWGVLAYLWVALQVTFRARPFHAVINTADTTYRVKTVQIAVGNGRHYGGGMTVDEHATIDDEVLHLYSVEVPHWWRIFWLMPHFLRGTFHRNRWVRTLVGKEFDVITHHAKRVNTDGELTTYTPVEFRLHPRAVTVIVPRVDETTPG